MRFSSKVVVGALATSASASSNYLGFNSGALKADNSAKFQSDFEAEFKTAQNLAGAPGKFNAVRLYTNIQAYSETTPIEAFQAAINTDTKILLGIWTSGTTSIDKELTALTAAVKKFGTKFTDLVIGISIGSEDLYRVSAEGVQNNSGVGANPDTIVGFIEDYKKAVSGTGLTNVPIGHVDTWDVWGNSSNKAVLDAVDWIGVDEYPYYETGKGNSIKNAGTLFDKAYDNSVATAGGKPVWVTETGWPATGPTWDEAVASVENAKYYWDEVGCRKLFGKTPTFWYNLRDSNSANTMKFGISPELSTTPLFNLTCPTTFDTPTPSSSAKSSTKTATESGKSASSTGTDSALATATGSSDASGTSDAKTTGTSSSASSSSVVASGASSAQIFSAVPLLALVAGVMAFF